MSPPEVPAEVGSRGEVTARPTDSLTVLVSEAARELAVCNACRYCEGMCAVFPALERRLDLTAGDVSQLANLCHDCRACFDACMYSSPHEFAIDLPQALASVRVADYRRYVWPRRVPRVLSGWSGLLLAPLLAAALVLAIALAHAGWSGLVRPTDSAASPYRVIPYAALLALMLAATAFAVGVSIDAGRRYWIATAATPARLTARAIARAVWQALTLRYLRGGGAECFYPEDDQPSPARRHLHGLVAYGFGLCLLSTVAAGVSQDIAGVSPPYPWLSVPVIAGTMGGAGLVIGAAGLLLLKTRSSEVTSVAAMTVKDYGLLVALLFLALSGIAVLLTRDTPAFGVVLVVHLSALVEAFVLAPYSKFVHVLFRFLALVRDNVEQQ